MHVAIGSLSGRIYRAEAEASFWRDHPTYAFVPDEALDPWRESVYREQEWPTINARLNPNAIGSEIWPNVYCPASEEEMADGIGKIVLQKIRERLALDQAPLPKT